MHLSKLVPRLHCLHAAVFVTCDVFILNHILSIKGGGGDDNYIIKIGIGTSRYDDK